MPSRDSLVLLLRKVVVFRARGEGEHQSAPPPPPKTFCLSTVELRGRGAVTHELSGERLAAMIIPRQRWPRMPLSRERKIER